MKPMVTARDVWNVFCGVLIVHVALALWIIYQALPRRAQRRVDAWVEQRFEPGGWQ